MLATPAPFPHPGSTAWLRPEGHQLRIIQHTCDGRLLCQRVETDRTRATRASGTTTVAMADVTADRLDAIESRASKRRRASSSEAVGQP